MTGERTTAARKMRGAQPCLVSCAGYAPRLGGVGRDGIEDAHAIYRQLPAVRRQFTCFAKTFFESGVARVPAPGADDAPCE